MILPAFWQPTSSDADNLIFSKPLPDFLAHAELGLVNPTPSHGKPGIGMALARQPVSLDSLRSGLS